MNRGRGRAMMMTLVGGWVAVGPSVAMADPVYVEMRPLRYSGVGGMRNLDITPVLQYERKAVALKACDSAPQLVETFVLEAATASLSAGKGGQPDIAGLALRLGRRAVSLLGADAPDKIHLVQASGLAAREAAAAGPLGLSRRCSDLMGDSKALGKVQ